jgi:hypothetical protein
MAVWPREDVPASPDWCLGFAYPLYGTVTIDLSSF